MALKRVEIKLVLANAPDDFNTAGYTSRLLQDLDERHILASCNQWERPLTEDELAAYPPEGMRPLP